jgi:hypothetical protein
MRISVIMPVYNAADFVREAVESALAQPEVAEVILVEDASPDGSLAVCEALAAEYDQVRLYRHPDGGNHGAGASRNLAIQHSTCPYIAFLDADDYFLPGRFTTARAIFQSQPDVEGVYEAVGAHFQSDTARQQWQAAGRQLSPSGLTTMKRRIAPEHLFEALVVGGKGKFSTIGLVIKRSILEKTGLFDENLHLHQDTALWIKMAALGRLTSGRLDEPVSMRRVHDHNRITALRSDAERQYHAALMWQTLRHWSRQKLDSTRQEMLFNAYLRAVLRPYRSRPIVIRQIQTIGHLTAIPLREPRLLVTGYFWKQYMTRTLRVLGLQSLVELGIRLRRSVLRIR